MDRASAGLHQETDETQKLSTRINRRKFIVVLILAAGVVVLYIGVASLSKPGFPLDDSWIHQTYAKNLAETGQWQYGPGMFSNGSTSPLWTFLLSIGYFLGLPFLWWTFFLGWLCLAWIAISAMGLWDALWPEYESGAIWIGLAIVLTWPLVWAAASGMETLLFTALVLQILRSYASPEKESKKHGAALGLLCGLVIVTRPDGLVLALLVAVGLMLKIFLGQQKTTNFLIFFGVGLLVMVPYFAFNRNLSGNWWPNTLYAKQAEYAFLWDQPLPIRMGQLLFFSLGGPESGLKGISGAQLLLLPGIVMATIIAFKKDLANRQLLLMMPVIWAAAHIFIYAWRLPVTYQHGRYLWPVIPIWIIYGFVGWRQLLTKIESHLAKVERARFIISSGIKITFGTMLLIFYLLGLQAYITDVAFINGEMVDVAIWLRDETPKDAIVAVHDIGAIGYFSERSLIDLAGLISPEVIPLLNDESLVEEYVRESDANYLVTAPGWPYEGITTSGDARRVYSTEFPWTQSLGFNNMAVYLLNGK